MKEKQITRLRGKSKGERPIVEKYTIGGAKDSHAILFLKKFVVIALLALLYYLHISQIVVWFNRNLICEKTIIAIDFNLLQIEVNHYFWSILNGLMMGVYLSALLPISGKRNKNLTIILVVAIVIISILSLGYLGIFIYANLPIFVSKTYISNQIEGAEFFITNLAFFLLLYAVSFIIEAEVD